jgi:ectoine hydroxylase-related dioxygenase (phytanoyl-CoA dioxygenase family)
VTGIPSQLAAAWIALEDVHPDAGPLAYYPGSHRIPKFDWGNASGLIYSSDAPRNELDFRDHIDNECARKGLKREVVVPRKGDVFLWHGALAHAGSPVRNPALTRRSFVVHYSSHTANPPTPRRRRSKEPRWYEASGARIYAHPDPTYEEDVLRHGADL